jgi:hypothetical protein
MAGKDSELPYGPWSGEITNTLIKGWSGSNRLKDACFKGARRSYDSVGIDHSIAINVLLQAFPQDSQVAQFCVEQITTEEYPFLGGDHIDSWRWLSESFRDHPDVIAAIDKWAPQQQYREPELSYAALVGRTDVMKQKLITSLEEDNNTIPHWAANALIDGWGMDDPEVARALMEVANGPPYRASGIAHLMPKMCLDADVAQTRLLELLAAPGNVRRDLIISGLASIAQSPQDETVVAACLKAMPRGRRPSLFEDIRGQLIFSFPGHPDIRNLAIDELLREEPNLGIVAHAYSDDQDMRGRVVKHLTPLPTQLRGMILRELGDLQDNDGFASSILSQYDAEPQSDLKVVGSIGYHRSLSKDPDLPANVIENLGQAISAQGFDYQARRLAAFAGLLILGRLDVVKNSPRASFELGYLDLNLSFLRLIAEYWSELQSHFGSDLAKCFSRDSNSATHFWTSLCNVAAEFPETHAYVLDALEADSSAATHPAAIRFLAAVKPASVLLAERCLAALEKQADSMVSEDHLAIVADVLASHFRGNPEIAAALPERDRLFHWSDGLILALCRVWPEDPIIDTFYAKLQSPDRPRIYPAPFQALTYSRIPATELPSRLILDLAQGERGRQHSLGTISPQLVARVRSETSLYGALEGTLKSTLDASGKTTIPKIMAAANGVSPELAAWCWEEIERQFAEDAVPEFGFDIFRQEVCPVVHSLLNVLDSAR